MAFRLSFKDVDWDGMSAPFSEIGVFFGCLGMVQQLVPCAWFLPVWFRCYVHIGYHRISYVKIMHLSIGTHKMHEYIIIVIEYVFIYFL